MPEDPQAPEVTPVKPCRKCDMGWGLIGIGAGVIIVLLGVDLFTGGALARLFTRTVEEEDDSAI